MFTHITYQWPNTQIENIPELRLRTQIENSDWEHPRAFFLLCLFPSTRVNICRFLTPLTGFACFWTLYKCTLWIWLLLLNLRFLRFLCYWLWPHLTQEWCVLTAQVPQHFTQAHLSEPPPFFFFLKFPRLLPSLYNIKPQFLFLSICTIARFSRDTMLPDSREQHLHRLQCESAKQQFLLGRKQSD